jgi:type IV pilus assembly protein PilX
MASLRTARRQRGVSLLIALIGLMLMMLGAVAMVRSFGTSSVLAGNLAFRRDLTNQGERGVAAARTLLRSGALAADTARDGDLPAANYAATRLATDEGGIPLLLLKDSLFASTGMKPENDIVDEAAAVRIRYVIDRQCGAPGEFDSARCAAVEGSQDSGGTNWLKKPTGGLRPVYRVTVRVDGPRSTQAFLQTTFSY